MGKRAKTTRQDERRAERTKTTLKEKMVSPGMLHRYQSSVQMFLTFAQYFGYRVQEWDSLVEVVSAWVEHIYHDDGQHKTLASDGLEGLQFFLPQLQLSTGLDTPGNLLKFGKSWNPLAEFYLLALPW